MAAKHRIAVIPGDGIGQEVIPAALTVLEAVAPRSGFAFDLVEFPYGCAYYAKNGRMMAADAFDRRADFPAIYIGAVGDPSVPDHIAVWIYWATSNARRVLLHRTALVHALSPEQARRITARIRRRKEKSCM
jgi:isocitrate/isopropylmalate dehydrogenase